LITSQGKSEWVGALGAFFYWTTFTWQ